MSFRRLMVFGLLAACDGVILDAAPVDPGPLKPGENPGMPPEKQPPPTFTCDPNAAPPSLPLRRLSHAQYANALNDFVQAAAPASAVAVLGAAPVIDALSQLPDDVRTATDDRHGHFRRMDQVMGQDHVDASLAVAKAVAAELTRTPARVSQLLGTCTNDAQCIRTFIDQAGARAHRRPLTQEDKDAYFAVYAATGIDAAGLADVIAVMLASPYFVYQVELGAGAPDARGVVALDDGELAARLSLHFWSAPPDATLTAMAASGTFSTGQGWRDAVTYVVASPRTAAAQQTFWREWLSLEDLPELDQLVGTPQFDALRGSFTPGPDTRENLIDEVVRLAGFYAAKPDGKLDDLFTTRRSFATTADVAALYGVERWSGQGEPPEVPGDRIGFFTRGALTASGLAETRPIMKGVFLRTTVLCDPVPPPPNNAMAIAQQEGSTLDPLLTTRQRVEALTERDGTVCASCHQTMINGLGYLTEGFDALGRARSSQKIFDHDGKLLGDVPVKLDAAPHVTSTDPAIATSAADLSRLMVESQKPHACFARRYFRYTFGRTESPATDGCALEELRAALVAGAPLSDVLTRVAFTSEFKQRHVD